MARLNEPPNESIESLKRRFIRQNRELARSNSTQSVKIRGLETHISQLVAENVSLRANILQLQASLDDSKNQRLVGHVDSVRTKLEAKLAECQSLITELDTSKLKHTKPQRDKLSSPVQRPRRESLGAEDVIGAREGWLPTIVEDKHYPRRTLEPSEVRASLSDPSSDSPDLGPPPRCSVEETILPNDSNDTEAKNSNDPPDDSAILGLVSVNMDMRRKRRDTHVRRDSNELTTLSNPEPKEPASANPKISELWTGQPVRAGSKRKLDIRNRPETNENFVVGNKDDIVLPQPAGLDVQNASPSRRVLAPKSANTDPTTSPKKNMSDETPNDRPTSKSLLKDMPRKSSLPSKSSSDAIQDHTQSPIALKLEPKTPAPLDLFSPPSTEHSALRQEGRGDTPPPADLAARNAARKEEVISGRGSRRARAAVSYAEPNLVSKMRRPTKDLVDAVTHDRSRSLSLSASELNKESIGESDEQPEMKTAHVKREQRKDNTNNSMTAAKTNLEPQSPLSSKDEGPNLDASKSRETANDEMDQLMSKLLVDSEDMKSSRPVTVSSRRQSAANRRSTKPVPATSALQIDNLSSELPKEDPDIYDLGPSPPRRLLSVPRSKADLQGSDARPTSAASNRPNPGTKSRTFQSDATTNQSSSRLTTASSAAVNRARSRRQTLGAGNDERVNKMPSTRQTSADTVKTTRSTVNLRNDEKTNAQPSETNVASRRRSMMV